VVRQNVTTGRSFPRLVCQPVDFVAPAMLRPCKGSTRERKLARAVLIGTMRVAQAIPVDGLSEAKLQQGNDGAVHRAEGRIGFYPQPYIGSLLVDRLVCPSRVRGASDLHGNSAHTRTAAA
jgi:hypothetical protein